MPKFFHTERYSKLEAERVFWRKNKNEKKLKSLFRSEWQNHRFFLNFLDNYKQSFMVDINKIELGFFEKEKEEEEKFPKKVVESYNMEIMKEQAIFLGEAQMKSNLKGVAFWKECVYKWLFKEIMVHNEPDLLILFYGQHSLKYHKILIRRKMDEKSMKNQYLKIKQNIYTHNYIGVLGRRVLINKFIKYALPSPYAPLNLLELKKKIYNPKSID